MKPILQKNAWLQIGDMIRINRMFYRHVGIYVGSRTPDGHDVIHNDKDGGVVLSTLAQFSGGSPVYLEKRVQGNSREKEAIAQRALALIGRQFDLLTFNCEHAANWAQSFKAESPQLQGAFAAALLLLGIVFIVRKK